MNKIKQLILIILFLSILYSCATSGSDPRSFGVASEDSGIENTLQSKFSDFNNANIYVNSYNDSVLLTGQVPDKKTKEAAEFEARATPGVRTIYNYLDIRLPQSIGAKTTDSYTTTQIRGKMLNIEGLNGNSIKVVTTNNVVYLAGIVTREQAKKVENAASSVNGVDKVVTFFNYVNR